jgi:hypothetical protein
MEQIPRPDASIFSEQISLNYVIGKRILDKLAVSHERQKYAGQLTIVELLWRMRGAILHDKFSVGRKLQ